MDENDFLNKIGAILKQTQEAFNSIHANELHRLETNMVQGDIDTIATTVFNLATVGMLLFYYSQISNAMANDLITVGKRLDSLSDLELVDLAQDFIHLHKSREQYTQSGSADLS